MASGDPNRVPYLYATTLEHPRSQSPMTAQSVVSAGPQNCFHL